MSPKVNMASLPSLTSIGPLILLTGATLFTVTSKASVSDSPASSVTVIDTVCTDAPSANTFDTSKLFDVVAKVSSTLPSLSQSISTV